MVGELELYVESEQSFLDYIVHLPNFIKVAELTDTEYVVVPEQSDFSYLSFSVGVDTDEKEEYFPNTVEFVVSQWFPEENYKKTIKSLKAEVGIIEGMKKLRISYTHEGETEEMAVFHHLLDYQQMQEAFLEMLSRETYFTQNIIETFMLLASQVYMWDEVDNY